MKEIFYRFFEISIKENRKYRESLTHGQKAETVRTDQNKTVI